MPKLTVDGTGALPATAETTDTWTTAYKVPSTLSPAVITVEDAVRAYTQGSAYAAFAESRVGTLEAGKLADLAVLSQDIFAASHERIGATRVTMTMVGGKVVYTAPP